MNLKHMKLKYLNIVKTNTLSLRTPLVDKCRQEMQNKLCFYALTHTVSRCIYIQISLK